MLWMSGLGNEPQAGQKVWTPTPDSYDLPWPRFLRLFIFIPPWWLCVMSEAIRRASWAGCPFIQITTLVVEGYGKQMGPLVWAIWGATAGWRWWWWRERPGFPPSFARPSNTSALLFQRRVGSEMLSASLHRAAVICLQGGLRVGP